MALRHSIAAGFAMPAIAVVALALGPGVPPADPVPGDVSPAQPEIPHRTFTLSEFGAVPDANTLNTEAFQRAIAAVDRAGGGTLIVPAGLYVTGPIDLCSGIDLHLEAGATIRFSPRIAPNDDGRIRPLLLAKDAHDVEISGEGTINGSGEAWWPSVHESMRNHKPRPARPLMVVFDHCVRVRVEGITLTHSPEFNLVPTHCQDVTIDGITIYNPADDLTRDDGVPPEEVWKQLLKAWDDQAPNTDGIDPTASQRVLITHCRIDTGDDCIAIKANDGAVTQDILITDCVFLHGNGCTIGSGERGGLRNMTVRHCTFEGTAVGVNLESARDRGNLVENVTYTDLSMRNVGEAIIITNYYPNGARIERPYSGRFIIDLVNGGHDDPRPVTATTPHWRNITVRNVSATCLWEAGLILGLPEMPIEKLVLDHVKIEAPEGLHFGYARDVLLRDVSIATRHGPSLLVSDTVEGLRTAGSGP